MAVETCVGASQDAARQMSGDASAPLLGYADGQDTFVPVQQAIVHYIQNICGCREEGNATILIEDATDPGWGPPPQEGASLFQATFNMVRESSAT